MLVTDLKIERHTDKHWTLSANVGGERIYFTYEGIDEPAIPTGDSFVIAALIPAMKRREALVVDESVPVSKQLLDNLDQYQEIYRHWYPAVSEVAVEAKNQIDHKEDGLQSGCFFSGGVDSIYTVSKTLEQLDYLVLCLGLDIPSKEPERWEKAQKSVRNFAEDVGLNLITVATNVKEKLECSDVDNHGAILISNAIGLGLEKIFVPASHTWDELYSWGSHPLTDPLLGNGRTQVIHHGNVSRTEKTQEVIRFRHGLEELRVCNVHSEYNCGKCEKCLRTMVCLAILQQKVSSFSLPVRLDLVQSLRLETKGKYALWKDNLQLAVEYDNRDFAVAIKKSLKRYERREGLKEIDRLLFRGFVMRFKRKFL